MIAYGFAQSKPSKARSAARRAAGVASDDRAFPSRAVTVYRGGNGFPLHPLFFLSFTPCGAQVTYRDFTQDCYPI